MWRLWIPNFKISLQNGVIPRDFVKMLTNFSLEGRWLVWTSLDPLNLFVNEMTIDLDLLGMLMKSRIDSNMGNYFIVTKMSSKFHLRDIEINKKKKFNQMVSLQVISEINSLRWKTYLNSLELPYTQDLSPNDSNHDLGCTIPPNYLEMFFTARNWFGNIQIQVWVLYL